MTPTTDALHAASTSAVRLDRSDRIRLEVTGPDRAKFLHNLTTNDVKRLPVGHGVEAFVTSPQGKTLGYVTLLADDARITVRTDPGGADVILPHLQKYGVFDDVAIDDVSQQTFEAHIAGPVAEDLLRSAGVDVPDPGALRHRNGSVAGRSVRVIRESPLGVPGFTLIGDRDDGVVVFEILRTAGAGLGLVDLDQDGAEVLRIAAGTPVFGRDVTPDNLPQEVARDDRAINFVKGCYLGQETVARIDALGHVNKLLRGLRLSIGSGEVPAPGSSIEADGKKVGTLTSVAPARGGGDVRALGYVRTSHSANGTPVEVIAASARVPAVVSDLPFPTD